ncbi:MAG: hypothetical protein IJ159_02975 [Prevotella sp.]|nr:hypothetical protein [Prevotella sp.]
MKKYLREIEVSGIILIVIGFFMTIIIGYFGGGKGADYGVWPCVTGMILLLVSYLYKAFHWKEYERENKQNIIIVLLTIALLVFNMLLRR